MEEATVRIRLCILSILAGALVSVSAAAESFTFTTLDVPGYTDTQAFGINNLGQIVGGTGAYPNTVGFLLSAGSFSTFSVPGAYLTQANGINDSGQIVGYDKSPANSYSLGFLLSGGGYTTLDVPGDFLSGSNGINDSGVVVGDSLTDYYFGYTGTYHGYSYSGGTYTQIDDPSVGPRDPPVIGTTATNAEGINNEGEIVGAYSGTPSNPGYGFLLDDGVFTTIAVPGAMTTQANGINDSGQIVGTYYDSSGVAHGFLYSNGVFMTIDIAGAQDTYLQGINNSDQIVGFYLDGSGNYDGFEGNPVNSTPEPATLLLFGAGLIAMKLRRRAGAEPGPPAHPETRTTR
jgi:probable HAF family extracellular repeat protein